MLEPRTFSASAPPLSTASAVDVDLSTPEVDCWITPDLVGLELHDAEAAIEHVTDNNPAVRTASLDASGQGRELGSHANWRVAWQWPEAGSWIRLGCAVSFHVVLDDEVGAKRHPPRV